VKHVPKFIAPVKCEFPEEYYIQRDIEEFEALGLSEHLKSLVFARDHETQVIVGEYESVSRIFWSGDLEDLADFHREHPDATFKVAERPATVPQRQLFLEHVLHLINRRNRANDGAGAEQPTTKPHPKHKIAAHNYGVAVKLASAGVHVFPVSTAKKPLCAWRNESTTDLQKIKNWWHQHTHRAIVGIDCGKSGLLVIDPDRHEVDKDGVANFDKILSENDVLPNHPITVTYSGGNHHIFRQPPEPLGNSEGLLKDLGINVRGVGGFIVAPGSVIPAGSILFDGSTSTEDGQWVADDVAPDLGEELKADTLAVCPEWLATKIRTRKTERPEKAAPGSQEAPRHERSQDGTLNAKQLSYARNALNGACDDLAKLADDRNNELNNKARHLGSMVDVGALNRSEVEHRLLAACYANGEVAKKGEQQCRATIRSGLDSHGDLPHNWTAHFEYDTQTGEVFEDDATNDTLPVGFIQDDGAELPEPDDLIKGLVPKADVMFIGGQSGAGKSVLAIHMAYCLASGFPFFGRKIKERVGVAILAAEGGGPSYMRRLRVARMHLRVPGNKDFAVSYLGDVPDLSDDKEIAKLVPRLRQLDRYYRKTYGVRLGVIEIDTVAAAFDLDDEDDNSEASKTIRRMKHLGQQVGALVVPVHHYGKMSTTGLRGASGWKAGCDAILSVLADIDQLTGVVKHRELALAKARDGEAGPVAPFDLHFAELGRDSDGEPFGSVYVEPALERASTIATSVKAKPDSDAMTVFRAAFMEMASTGISYRVRGTGPEVKAVRLADVRAEFVKRYPTGETDAKKRNDTIRSAFRRGKKDAMARGFGFENTGDDVEMVWLPAKGRDA
jgi:hypothetical protein